MNDRLMTFVDISGMAPRDAGEHVGVSGDLIVNVTWLGATAAPDIPNIRQFGNTKEAQDDARELLIAARAITMDWLRARPSRWAGVHAGQLIEDPLGVIITELAMFSAAVKACLTETRVDRLRLVGSKNSTWLRFGAAIAHTLGVPTERHLARSLEEASRRAARVAWPLISPVGHATARHIRRLRATARDRAEASVDYLIVSESRRDDHLAALDRVARSLGGEQGWVLPWNPDAAPAVEEWLDGHGYRAVRLGDYYNWGSVAAETAERLALSRYAHDEITRLLRTHLADKSYAWPVMDFALCDAAWRMNPRAEGLARAAQNLLRRLRPRVILLMSDYNYTSRILTVAARAEKIPTVQLQHGIWAGPDDNPMWGIPVLSTRIALWNDFIARWYRRHGTPEEKLVVTGNPRYDCFSEPIPESERVPDDGTPRVLIITDALPVAETTALLAAVRKAVLTLPFPVQVLVKVHPNESVGDVIPLLGDWGANSIRVQREGDSTALVRQATVVVAIISTVIFEAILTGCPVVLVAYPGFSKFEFQSETPLLVAREEGEAVKYISAVLNDPAYAADCRLKCREYSARYWPLCGNGAAQRVADVVLSLADATIAT